MKTMTEKNPAATPSANRRTYQCPWHSAEPAVMNQQMESTSPPFCLVALIFKSTFFLIYVCVTVGTHCPDVTYLPNGFVNVP